MTHILILPSWYPSDSQSVNGIFFRDQAVALSSFGHNIGVISVFPQSLRTAPKLRLKLPNITEYENDYGIHTYRKRIWAALPRIPYGNYMLWKRAANQLLEEYISAHGHPDLIHAHSAIFAGAVAIEWKKKYGFPVILTEHSSAFARGYLRNWQLQLTRQALPHYDATLSVSPALSEVLSKTIGTSEGGWQWVPNLVANRFRSPNCERRDKSQPIRFFNLALMSKNKGQRDLLVAFSQAFSKNSKVELWIAGDGPERNDLEALAMSLRISDCVKFLGLVPPARIPELYEKIDVTVVSSHYESFGIVLAESLICGRPVIATQCGGPEHIVQKGDGFLVPSRDTKAMAAALSTMAKQLSTIDSNALSARARARFSEEAVATQLTQIYNLVMAINRQTRI